MPVKSEPVVADGSMAGNNHHNNNNRPPWHDNKDALLRKLQKSVHFVKTITPSSIGGQYTLALPTWFVRKHGDKFQQTVFLQSGILPVTEPWRVRLNLCTRATHGSIEVKFCTGWREFARVHDLAEGDDLLFSLHAMSQFDVYVFRKPAPPRKRSRGFDEEVPLPKTGNYRSSDEAFSGGDTRTTKPNMGEENGPVFAFHGRSMSGRCASTCDLHYLVSRNLREPPRLRSDDSHQRQEPPIHERKNDDGARNPKATSPPSFRKRPTECDVRRGAGRLEIPPSLSRSATTYAGGPPVVEALQGIHERSPERIVVCKWWKTGENPGSSSRPDGASSATRTGFRSDMSSSSPPTPYSSSELLESIRSRSCEGGGRCSCGSIRRQTDTTS